MQQRRAVWWLVALTAAVLATSVAWVMPVTASAARTAVPQTVASTLCGSTGTDLRGTGCRYDTVGTDTFTAPYYQPEVTFTTYGARSAGGMSQGTLAVTPGARYQVNVGGAPGTGSSDVRGGAYGRSDRLVLPGGDPDERRGRGQVVASWPDGPATAAVSVTSSPSGPVDPDTWVTLTTTVTTSTGVAPVGTVRLVDRTRAGGSPIAENVIDASQDGTHVARVRADSLTGGPDHAIVAIFEDRYGEIQTARSAPTTFSVTGSDTSGSLEVDLGLSLTAAPGPVTAGSDLAYTLGVTNYSTTTAASVDVPVIGQDVSGDVALSSDGTSSSCTSLPTEVAVSCDFGDVAPGTTETATVVLTARTAGQQVTSAGPARSDQPDPSSGNDLVEIETEVDPAGALPAEPQAALSISKVGPDQVTGGDVITYRLTAGNQGPDVATGVTATDVLPDGVTFTSDTTSPPCTSSSGTVTCDFGDLEVGQQRTVEFGVTADRLGTVSSTATIEGNEIDPDSGVNDFSTVTTTVRTPPPPADLSVTTTAPDRLTFGDDLTYRIAVTNDGPTDATEVTTTDVLPSNVRFTSAGTSTTCSQDVARRTVTCDFGSIADGETETAEISVLPDRPARIVSSATVASSETDPDMTNNVATASTRVRGVESAADLSIEKTVSADRVRVGEDITYRLEVTNTSSVAAFDVVATDTLPAEVSFTEDGTSTDCTHDAGTVRCDIGRIPAGQTATAEVVVSADDVGVASSTATIASGGVDGDPSNDTSTATTQIDGARRPGVVSISMVNHPVAEGGAASVSVTRIGGSAGSVSIDYTTSNGTAGDGDYTPISGTLVFADGDTTKSFSVPTLQDRDPEFRETIDVTLSSPVGRVTVGRSESTVTIVANDTEPPARRAG